jgi:ribose transport system permease protein
MRSPTRAAAAFVRRYAVLLMIVILGLFLSLGGDGFLTPVNLFNVVNQSAPLLVVAAALTLVVIGGGFDLSTGAIYALSAVVTAWAAHDGTLARQFGANACFIVGPMVGLGLGVINGAVITGFRIHSFLATLATGLIFRGVAKQIAGGNSITLFDLMPGIEWFGQDRFAGVTVAFIVMLVFCLVMQLTLTRTVFGRHLFAVGGNEEAAVLAGIEPARVKIWAFALVGLASGLAGAIGVSRVLAAKATDGAGFEFDAIAAVILGGTSINGGAGAVWRSCAGVILLALINNGFNILQTDPLYKDIAKGLIIIVAVTLSATRRR